MPVVFVMSLSGFTESRPVSPAHTSQTAGTSISGKGNDGAYVFAERKLTGETKEGAGLAAWARLGVADDTFNAIESYLGGGLVYTGPLKARPEDQLGLAVAHARLGTPYRRALELAGDSTDRHETNIELTYRASLAPCRCTPMRASTSLGLIGLVT